MLGSSLPAWWRATRRGALVLSGLAAAAVAAGPGLLAAPASASSLARAQTTASTVNAVGEFLARSSVNALGVLPAQGTYYTTYQKLRADCTPGTLGNVVRAILTSSGFGGLGYSQQQEVVALFRTALGRDPTANEYHSTLELLESNDPWTSVINHVLASTSFTTLVDNSICRSGLPNYHPETTQPVAMAGSISESSLQTQLDQAAKATAKSAKVVELPSARLILLTAPLSVPSGVTLETAGTPPVAAYLKLARFARDRPFNSPLIRVHPGATVSHIWLDGERMRYPSRRFDSYDDGWNILTLPGPQKTTVTGVRADNPAGPQNIRLEGSTSTACAGSTVSASVIVNYSNDPQNGGKGIERADGVFARCEHSLVERNEILDPSDTATIVFHATGQRNQASQVLYNDALLAGNKAPAVMDADEFSRADPGCAKAYCSFKGTLVAHNTLWSGPCVSAVFGLAVGTRAFSRDFNPQPPRDGRYAKFEDNGTGPAGQLWVAVELYVSGMYYATVTGNFQKSHVNIVPRTNCSKYDKKYPGPQVFVGHGGGYIQAHHKLPNPGLDECING